MKKVWFITGCSKGFGRVLVEELLEHTDAYVIATARNSETLHSIIEKYSNRISFFQVDVTAHKQIQNAVNEGIQKFGRIDVLVNNAGYGLVGALEECAMEDIQAVFQTNVFGLMAATKAILPHMRSQKSGHIINISSIAGLVAMAGSGVYASTKFAVEGISEALAAEVADFGIKVILIEPGPFRTDFAGGSVKTSLPDSDYANTPAGHTRTYMQQIHNNQPGDPIKAAKIMIDLVEMQNPPLRLLLGKMALDRLAAKTERQTQEFKDYENLALSADY